MILLATVKLPAAAILRLRGVGEGVAAVCEFYVTRSGSDHVVALPAGRAAWSQTALQIRQPDGLAGVAVMAPADARRSSFFGQKKDLFRPHAVPSAGKTHQGIRFIRTRARLPGCGQPPGRRP
jgi:hypothetical protein